MTKKALSDLKTRNILISSLGVKVLYYTSHHKSAQGMWDALQTLYEGTEDVKDSKINMLTQEFEIFRMESGESMESMKTRFLHLIKKPNNLGKSISNKVSVNKMYRSMCMVWQPKVTSIK